MRGIYIFFIFCIFFVTILFFKPGCTYAEMNRNADFTLAYLQNVFPGIDARDATAALKVWIGEFGRQLGYTTESRLYENIEPVIKGMQDGNIDFVVLSSVDYLRIKHRVDVELAVASVRGGKISRKYLLLVNGKRDYMRLGDLKKARLAMTKGDEVGPLFLNALLLKQKYQTMQSFFSRVEEKTKVSQTILSVFFGQSDLCVADEVSFKTAVEMNPQIGSVVKVIASSPDITDSVSIFRKGLRGDVKRSAVKVCTGLKDSQRGRQVLLLFKMEDLAPVKDNDLASLKDLLNEYERLRVRR